jgi:Mg2+ and Co2+ transporter CorA
MSEEDRSMTLFYTIESINDTLKFIESNLDTNNENDMHRLARLMIIEEQLVCMADHINVKNKALQTA